MKDSFAKNSFFYFLTDCIVLVLSFATNVLIARWLGPEGKGVLTLIFLIPALSTQLFNFGLHQSCIYFLGKIPDKSKEIINNLTVFSLVVGVMSGLLYFFLCDYICSWFNLVEFRGTVIISAFLFPIFLFSESFQNILLGLKLFKQLNIVRLIDASVFFIFTAIFLLMLKFQILGGVLAKIIGASFTIFVILWFLYKSKRFPRIGVNYNLLKDNIVYGMKSQFGNILQIFTYRFDVFFVNFFLGAAGVGIYSVAYGVAELIWHVPNAIGKTLFPTVSHEGSNCSNEFIASVCRKTILLSIFAAIAMAISAGFIINLFYGNKFSSSVVPLLVLLPGIIAIAIHKVIIFSLMGKGYPHYMSYSGIISIVSTIVLDIILIPKFGISGAALASTLSYMICALFTINWFIKTTKLNFFSVIIPNSEDVLFIINKAMISYRRIVK